MVFAGICAGGKGERFGSHTPKQFLMLKNKPVICYSAETLLKCKKIHRLFIAVHRDWISCCEDLFRGKAEIIEAGETRAETVALLAQSALAGGGENDILLTHDAARPFVTVRAIEECIAAGEKFGASGTAVKASDTVLQCRNGEIIAAPPRNEMLLAQTPQCFKLGVFQEVWSRLSEEERAQATDVCGMFFRAGVRVRIVEGDMCCFKITHREDMERAERIAENYSAAALAVE